MGPAIYILTIAFLTLLLLVSALILLWQLRRLFGLFRKPVFTWLFVLGPLLVGAVLAAGVAWRFVGPTLQPAEATFRSIFGEDPPESITLLEHAASGGTDYGTAAVRFRIDGEPTLSNLIALAGAKAATLDVLKRNENDYPVWWNRPTCPELAAFSATNAGRWEEIDIAYCPSTRIVDAYAEWID